MAVPQMPDRWMWRVIGWVLLLFEKPEGGASGFVLSHLASKERSQNGARCIVAATGLSVWLGRS
jgi:hypothetical protein